MSSPGDVPRFSDLEVIDALRVLSSGRAWRDRMGHSARINRLARFLTEIDRRPLVVPTQRLVLTPEQARRYPEAHGDQTDGW
ncbi:MAG TPA: hypothetical protein DCQ64_06760 [Candidatus Rokubacteria bacterium]|nr:hypothetical protein [Candidatus Rokubacteria bacterium]